MRIRTKSWRAEKEKHLNTYEHSRQNKVSAKKAAPWTCWITARQMRRESEQAGSVKAMKWRWQFGRLRKLKKPGTWTLRGKPEATSKAPQERTTMGAPGSGVEAGLPDPLAFTSHHSLSWLPHVELQNFIFAPLGFRIALVPFLSISVSPFWNRNALHMPWDFRIG